MSETDRHRGEEGGVIEGGIQREHIDTNEHTQTLALSEDYSAL